MQDCPLILENGHLFVGLPEGTFLLDTGAPNSFGKASPVTVEEQQFKLPTSYMGLSAGVLSTYVSRYTDGILGGDILNQFDVLIDVQQSRISLSTAPLVGDGEELAIELCLGVPIVIATIAGESVRMFFDTGAQISYFQDDLLTSFPTEEKVTDYYPGIGQFSTATFRVPVQLGRSPCELRCGQLPSMLGMALMMADVKGIIGNEVLRNRIAGYFPRRHRLFLS